MTQGDGTVQDAEKLREELRLLRQAHEARGRLLARQRWEFADRLRDETSARDEELARLQAEVDRLEREVSGKQRELETLLDTKTFRYTSALRGAWGRLRRRR